MKTSELIGAALDWAVAKCEGIDTATFLKDVDYYTPSSDWLEGGPIIEREYIDLNRNDAGEWYASTIINYAIVDRNGPTPLIAAMRCYVASKLGDEIEIPKELI